MAKRLPTGITPDLAGVHATRLSFEIELSNAAVSQLLQRLGVEKADVSGTTFVSDYSKRRKKHQAYAVLGAEHAERVRGFPRAILVLYDLAPVAFGPDTRPVVELLSALTELDLEAEVECTAGFEYSGADWASVVALPWQPLQMPGLPFDEFRGFRAVKKRNGDVLYHVIVDRPTNEEVSHAVSFSYPAKLDMNLPVTLLQRAVDISKLFVMPRAAT